MNKEQEKKYLIEAEKMAADGVDFKTFHNHFFSQTSPLLRNTTREERIKFIKSPLYKQLTKLEIKLGVEQGYLTTNKKTGKPVEREFSGEFRLRIAVSLHQRLVVEARREQVSLNQLCLIKLAQPLSAALRQASTAAR